MPTIFFIFPKEPIPRDTLIAAATHLSNNTKQSEFLSKAGYEIRVQQGKNIAIVVNSVFLFDPTVTERAREHIDNYLKILGLHENFACVGLCSKSYPLEPADYKIERPGQSYKASITLKRISPSSLYDTREKIEAELVQITNLIERHNPLCANNRCDYDHDHQRYLIRFVHLSLNTPEELLQFQGSVVYPAITTVGKGAYEIDGFSLEEYYQFLKNQLPASAPAEPLSEEDRALYDDMPSSPSIDKKVHLSALLKKHNSTDYAQALRRAAGHGESTDLAYLIQYAPLDINACDENPQNKKTALHHAVKNGHPECARLLLQAGARKDIKDFFGKTAENYARESNNPDMLSLFTPNLAPASTTPPHAP